MHLKNYLDFRVLGLTGSILIIISEFLTWFSGFSLLDIYIFTTSLPIVSEESFLYIFPLISGSICAIGTLLIIFKKDFHINSVIINFVGLGFFLIFMLELIPTQIDYLLNSGIGFYLSILGAILVFLDIIYILVAKKY